MRSIYREMNGPSRTTSDGIAVVVEVLWPEYGPPEHDPLTTPPIIHLEADGYVRLLTLAIGTNKEEVIRKAIKLFDDACEKSEAPHA